MTTSNEVTGWYAHVFKAWDAKAFGPKPTAEMLNQIHGLGARPGKQALANSMTLRADGVTGSQIVMVCGAPQLNKLRGFITDGLLKREAHAPDKLGHTVYKCTVTAKGVKRIETAAKRAAELAAKQADTGDKPVKAKPVKKAPAKARKAKPEPKADEPHVTELPVNQLVTDAPAEQPQA